MASSERLKPLVVVLCNEVILESGKQRKEKAVEKFSLDFLSNLKPQQACLLLNVRVLEKSQKSRKSQK